MKKMLKGIFIPVIIAVICGCVLGRFVYKTYLSNLYDNLRSSKLYLVENGEYESIDSMREHNYGNNYVYYEDDNKYKTVVGITNNYNNVDKIKDLYDDNVSVLEYYIQNDHLDSRQNEYEKKLNQASDIEEVRDAVTNILNLYRSDDSIRLIAIN